MPSQVNLALGQSGNTQIHPRKSTEDAVLPVDTDITPNGIHHHSETVHDPGKKKHLALPPERRRVGSTPGPYSPNPTPPPSAGHTRTSFPAQLSSSITGSAGHPSSPLRPSFPTQSNSYSQSQSHSHSHSHTHSHSHSRTRSTPFSPPPHLHLHPSPAPSPTAFSFPTSPTSPDLTTPVSNGFATLPAHSRRHTRLHSRNLSVFFPRPDSLSHPTIEEDGAQELNFTAEVTAPVSTIPNASSSVSVTPSGQLGAGFTFGGRPPNSADLLPSQPQVSAGGTSRRGHHHKHSLSHNFFSFLEPGTQTATLHTQPTPIPVSPWSPISPIPPSAAPNKTSFPTTQRQHADRRQQDHSPAPPVSRSALPCAIGQFVLGAWLWVVGQQIASLGCTGLGYWVVFDAMGVAVHWIIPGWLAVRDRHTKARLRRPYGYVILASRLGGG